MKNSRRILALVMAVGVDFRAQVGKTNPGHVHYRPRVVEVSRSASFVTSSGAIAVVGYNDMRQMLEAMVALFVAAHPNVRFELDLRGTRFAPAALAAGTSAFAPMGGEFTPRQLNEYRAATGSDPMPFRVAHASLNPQALSGPLAIFVHRDNPLRWLTIAQAARYSWSCWGVNSPPIGANAEVPAASAAGAKRVPLRSSSNRTFGCAAAKSATIASSICRMSL